MKMKLTVNNHIRVSGIEPSSVIICQKTTSIKNIICLQTNNHIFKKLNMVILLKVICHLFNLKDIWYQISFYVYMNFLDSIRSFIQIECTPHLKVRVLFVLISFTIITGTGD